jgi:hypothetical protein
MRRTQILLEEEQHRFLADEANRRGTTVSALLRQWIDEHIHAMQRIRFEQDPLWEVIGIARSGVENISEEHDRYLADARRRRSVSEDHHGD